MKNTVNLDPIAVKCEQDAIISYAQPILRREVGQSFDVASEVVPERFDFCDEPLCDFRRQTLEVANGLWTDLEVELHSQGLPESLRGAPLARSETPLDQIAG